MRGFHATFVRNVIYENYPDNSSHLIKSLFPVIRNIRKENCVYPISAQFSFKEKANQFVVTFTKIIVIFLIKSPIIF
jgi:hypothetical protein